MSLPLESWHARYQQQAGWTAGLRRYVLQQIRLSAESQVLEFGCGTGAIAVDLAENDRFHVTGLDRDLPALQYGRAAGCLNAPVCADALRSPFPAKQFDAVVCHMFLLWVSNPLNALREAARLVRPGGWVVAFAEPDYAARIDYPEELANLGRLQAAALTRQGANPNTGRRLLGLFHQAGLESSQSGILGGQFQAAPPGADFEQEWAVLRHDLDRQVPADELERLCDIDRAARERGERILFVPTFYAWGRKSTV
ncbi:MAG: methyltransferase domain-containing protein [Anaerolineae bacterium]|nr:methyltransferase domain-containing protein [Anaerolineae bacterium]